MPRTLKSMKRTQKTFGELLREWREHRRKSQLTLALDSSISTKHLSFLETGRSAPSREMVLRLTRILGVPLRARNTMLHAAGFAPAFKERSLDDPSLAAARRAVESILRAHEPFPALAIDRHWNMIAHNEGIPPLLSGVDAELLVPPVNVLILSLHPRGLAPRIENLAAWRAHLFERLERQIEASADPKLEELRTALLDLPVPKDVATDRHEDELAEIAVPLEIETDAGTLSFLSTTSVFGTPVDVTLSEIALECFFPADARTAALLGAPSYVAK